VVVRSARLQRGQNTTPPVSCSVWERNKGLTYPGKGRAFALQSLPKFPIARGQITQKEALI
jgi:hypothetical protein